MYLHSHNDYMYLVHPSGAGMGKFQANQLNAMAADALAPCIAWHDIDYAG